MAASKSARTNRNFYNTLWSETPLQRPERFNTWPLVSELLPSAQERLEIGPGLRPRLPIAGTHFIDASQAAVERLNQAGATGVTGTAGLLPFPDNSFDLVCAFDVIEHIEDDHAVFRELSRVVKDGGVIILSVPLHTSFWTEFDSFVGHVRRYEPDTLPDLLYSFNLRIERSAPYGMQPNCPRLLQLGVWWLKHRRAQAMWWYNHVFTPLAIFFQKPLSFVNGLLETSGVAEVVIVCRRMGSPREEQG